MYAHIDKYKEGPMYRNLPPKNHKTTPKSHKTTPKSLKTRTKSLKTTTKERNTIPIYSELGLGG
jgi:hypothetical protein